MPMRDADRVSVKPMSRTLERSDGFSARFGTQCSERSPLQCALPDKEKGDVHWMQVWAGQSAALAKAEPADDLVRQIWNDVRSLIA
jgi:NAD(P)H-dependent flavin oxidoreductase YrpB (nitropropane dioxygenase family)